MKISIRRTLFTLIILFFLVLRLNSFALAQESYFLGTWLTDVKSHITIKECDEGLCGYISKVTIREELYQKHKEEIDKIGIDNVFDYFNEDPKLRSRLLLGLKVLTLNEKVSPSVYKGEVYNPEDGKTYSGKVEIINNNQLRLTGCTFFGIICRSEDWYRVGYAK